MITLFTQSLPQLDNRAITWNLELAHGLFIDRCRQTSVIPPSPHPLFLSPSRVTGAERIINSRMRNWNTNFINFCFALPPEVQAELPSLNLPENTFLQKTEKARLLREEMRNSEAVRTLEVLDISHQNLRNIPPEIALFSALVWIDAPDNQLSYIPEQIGSLRNLQILNFYNNKIMEVPQALKNLRLLTSLNLSYNKITELPDDLFEGMTALTDLDINNNAGLTKLPSSIGNLTALEGFLASCCGITTLPEGFANLSRLRRCIMEYSNLISLPMQFGRNFPELTELYLNGNRLTSLPNAFVQMSALSSVDLSDNEITLLPRQMGRLTSVSELKMRNNRLSSLPAGFDQMADLQYLDLRNNEFRVFPVALLLMSNLSKLDMAKNQLTHLPAEIADLGRSQFWELDLGYNQLQSDSIPARFPGRFNIAGNLIDPFTLPPEVTEGLRVMEQYNPWRPDPDDLAPTPAVVAIMEELDAEAGAQIVEIVEMED